MYRSRNLYFKFEGASGAGIHFWYDCWCRDMSLKGYFSIHILIDQRLKKETAMADLMQEQNGTVFWNVLFTRSCQDWELELLHSFFTHLYCAKIEGAREDRLTWLLTTSGIFEVKS